MKKMKSSMVPYGNYNSTVPHVNVHPYNVKKIVFISSLSKPSKFPRLIIEVETTEV